MEVTSCSLHIYTQNSTFVPNAPGVIFRGASGCTAQDLLVDNVSFAGVDLNTNEGRLSTEGPVNGLTVTNSFFGNNGYSDGIQVGGGTNIVIGPGNVFDGVSQSYCSAHGGAHCDGIQLYAGSNGSMTVTGNWFKNTNTPIMAPDGGNGIVITHNVFDGCWQNYSGVVQFGSNTWALSNVTFSHNTLLCGNAGGWRSATNITAKNNIFYSSGSKTSTLDDGPCSGTCVYDHNLFNNSGQGMGTNRVIATPVWVGGVSSTTWAGWQLTASSPGKNAGDDGQDLGTTYYGGTAPPPPPPPPAPAAPSNVRIIL
jgi:hypothetical protein